jgi:hypothetical protein
VPFFHLLLGQVVRQELGAVLWRAFGVKQVKQPVEVLFEQVRQLESQALHIVPSIHVLLGQVERQELGAVL